MTILKATILGALATLGPWSAPTLDDLPDRPPVRQVGMSTTYGLGGLHGDTTATGEHFRPREEITCAHKSIPLGTTIMVESVETGRAIWCRINDRGPYAVETGDGRIKAVDHHYQPTDGEQWIRILDMSVAASRALGEWGLYEVKIRFWGGWSAGRFARPPR